MISANCNFVDFAMLSAKVGPIPASFVVQLQLDVLHNIFCECKRAVQDDMLFRSILARFPAGVCSTSMQATAK